jgi:O-antigen/teichoic acid export membrane protein
MSLIAPLPSTISAARQDTWSQQASARFVQGTIASLVVRIAGVGVMLVCQMVLARWLGAGQYGELALVISWVTTLGILAKGGWELASTRFVAEYAAAEQWSLLAGFRQARNRAVLWTCAVMSALSATALVLFHQQLSPNFAAACWIMLPLLPVIALADVFAADLRARQEIVWATAPLAILRPLSVIVLVVTIGHWMSLDAVAAAAVWLIASLVVLLASWWKAETLLHRQATLVAPHSSLNSSTIRPLAWIAGCHVIFGQADLLIVGLMCHAEDAGVYSAAARISSVVAMGLLVVNTVGSSLIAEEFALARRAELQRIATSMARGSLVLTVLAALGALVLGPWLLASFGDGFQNAYPSLAVLVIGQVVNSLCGSVGQLLAMTGHQRTSARVLGAFAAIQIVLCLVMIPIWGLFGAAVATTVARIGWNLLLVFYVRRELGINPTALAWSTK